MYQIYFGSRAIRICSKECNWEQYPNQMILANVEYSDFKDISSMFEQSEHISNLIIPTDDPKKTFERFSEAFTQINAAGGVVANPDGEYLFIFRHGVWDLPKGKQEDGEDIKITAIREVKEECGVENITLGDYICTTRHTYRRDGLFMLKHTYWYKMSDSSKEKLIPQTEESISSAKWVKSDDVKKCLINTYPSIREVINHLEL